MTDEQEFKGFAGSQNFYKHMAVDPPKKSIPSYTPQTELKIIELLKDIKVVLWVIVIWLVSLRI